MKSNWRRMMTALGLGAALASSMVVTGCVVRARAGVTTEPVYEVEESPPPPREEVVTVRPGYVWVRGNWEFRGGQWVWRAGHWQRERSGYVWEAGHWERRGNHYQWIEGRWEMGGRARVERPQRQVEVRDRTEPVPEPEVRDHRTERPHHEVTVSIYPTQPPPAPRVERPAPRAGYVWIAGHYRWENGRYEWLDGHWERARARMHWEPGRWQRRGNNYVWVEGRWR